MPRIDPDARYDILTWDVDLQEFTEQVGMDSPTRNVPWQGLLRALRELRTLGRGGGVDVLQ